MPRTAMKLSILSWGGVIACVAWIALSSVPAAAQSGSPNEGACGQMRSIYGAQSLWHGKLVGQDFTVRSGGSGTTRTLNRTRCFTTAGACQAWLNELAKRRQNVTYAACKKGRF